MLSLLYDLDLHCPQKPFVLSKDGGGGETGRKHCGGKREIAPFPTVFSNDFYSRHIKPIACKGKD